jgi:hypothetical protein
MLCYCYTGGIVHVSVGISNCFSPLVQISHNISENLHLACMFKGSFALAVNGCITVMGNVIIMIVPSTETWHQPQKFKFNTLNCLSWCTPQNEAKEPCSSNL